MHVPQHDKKLKSKQTLRKHSGLFSNTQTDFTLSNHNNKLPRLTVMLQYNKTSWATDKCEVHSYQLSALISHLLAACAFRIKMLSLKKKCAVWNIPRNVRAMLDSVGPSLPINTIEYSSNIDPLSNLKFLPSFASTSASGLLLEVASSETTTLGNSDAISSTTDSGKKKKNSKTTLCHIP